MLGRYIAYQSDESGVREVCVLPLRRRARRRDDGLRLEVDRDLAGSLRRLDVGGELIDHRLVDHDGQDAVLEAV